MKLLVGGLISIMLLGLYVHLVYLSIQMVDCVNTAGCTRHAIADFNDGMTQSLSAVGGLVSVLVIAELAVTAHKAAHRSRACRTTMPVVGRYAPRPSSPQLM